MHGIANQAHALGAAKRKKLLNGARHCFVMRDREKCGEIRNAFDVAAEV